MHVRSLLKKFLESDNAVNESGLELRLPSHPKPFLKYMRVHAHQSSLVLSHGYVGSGSVTLLLLFNYESGNTQIRR